MKRYSEELLKGLKQSASIQMDGNLKMISKYAPDAISPTAIDPRMLAGKSGLGLQHLQRQRHGAYRQLCRQGF